MPGFSLPALVFITMVSGEIRVIYYDMSVVVNFVAGKLIEAQKTKRARKAWLVVGIVYDLGWLILFKYLGFLIENLNALFGAMHVKVQLETWNLILPIGISFYTFQIISLSGGCVPEGNESGKIVDFTGNVSLHVPAVNCRTDCQLPSDSGTAS